MALLLRGTSHGNHERRSRITLSIRRRLSRAHEMEHVYRARKAPAPYQWHRIDTHIQDGPKAPCQMGLGVNSASGPDVRAGHASRGCSSLAVKLHILPGRRIL